MSTNLIRWERANDVAELGFAGSHEPWLFQIWTGGEQRRWQLITATTLGVDERPESADPGELKQQAETWLREFASSLGALFATDLREHLSEQAAIQQELGDGHDELGHSGASREHWGAARALAEVGKWLDHELETR